MSERFLTDKTIKKYLEEYGREGYISIINEKLEKGEQDYKRGKKKLLHILERIKNL